MAGSGVGQVDPAVALAPLAAVQVPAGQSHLAGVLAVQANREGAGIGVEGGDGPAGAVGDPELGDGVAAAHHPIPDGQLALLDLEAVGVEAAAGGQQLLAGAVEPVDLGPAAGQYDHVLRRVALGVLPGLPPVGEQGEGGGRFGVGGHHPVMGPVGGDCLVDQPGADEFEGFAFPGVVLPPVLQKFGGAEAEAEGAEAAAGVDGGQLPVVADQHHLGLGALGVVEEAGKLAGAEHARLVHHQHRPSIQLLAATVQVGQQPVAGGHLLKPSASKLTVAIPVGAVARSR
jgi:hypothetical protein